MEKQIEIAIFGGGCFWCTEAVFSRIKGVKSAVSGYAGGKMVNPDYMRVSSEKTGHAEVVKIEFDPKIISYNQLLEVFWYIHNPTSLNRQGNDEGTQYRSIILYTSKNQKNKAEKSLKEMQEKLDKSIVTEIKSLDRFYDAESYHQKYFEKNSSQSYCTFVVAPKVSNFEKRYGDLLRN